MRRHLAIVTCWLTLTTVAAHAAPLPPDAAGASALALAFAPTLVFHPDERYFPVSPLFPLAPQDVSDMSALDVDTLLTPEARVDIYDRLDRAGQLARATLPYRVFAIGGQGHPRVVVEYWCHYVFNDYTFHGGVIGWRAADNHHNDLERVVFELERIRGDEPIRTPADAVRDYAIRRIVASAHDGSVTANVLDVDAAHQVLPPVAVLVERGSHAMAPDIDDDGQVTLGRDVNPWSKFVWGIRDHGEGGVRYRVTFADDRSAGVRLCGAETAQRERDCAAYALQPADPLQDWFYRPATTAASRDAVVGRSSWLFKWFGDVQVEDLLVPRDAADTAVITALTNRRAEREGGLSIGSIIGDPRRPVAIGGRWAWMLPGRLMPDVLVSGDLAFSRSGLTGLEMSAAGFYQLDVVTKAVVGLLWRGHGAAGDPRWDVLAGVEFRAGRLRIRPDITLRRGIRGAQMSLVF